MTVKELMQLKLERHSSLDMVSGKYINTVDLCIAVDQIKAGLIKEIGCRNFSVLLAIGAHLNEQRVAFPNVSAIAEITGLSKPTVIKAIQELEEVEIGGQPIIKKSKLLTSSGNAKSVYHFLGAEIAETDPKEVIQLFCEYYEETFGVVYNVSWGRDVSMVKTKLISQYKPEQLKEIVRIAVTKYSTFSNSPEYPTPTLGMLCSWLANAEKAAAIDPTDMLDSL